jgi:hypothetical protein
MLSTSTSINTPDNWSDLTEESLIFTERDQSNHLETKKIQIAKHSTSQDWKNVGSGTNSKLVWCQQVKLLVLLLQLAWSNIVLTFC